MKIVRCLVLAPSFVLVAAAASAQPAAVPEMLTNLHPAAGYLPASRDGESTIYRFQVLAVATEGPHDVEVTAEVFLTRGETVRVSGRRRGSRIDGTVTLTESGNVTYRVALSRKGQRITSSSASLALEEPSGR